MRLRSQIGNPNFASNRSSEHSRLHPYPIHSKPILGGSPHPGFIFIFIFNYILIIYLYLLYLYLFRHDKVSYSFCSTFSIFLDWQSHFKNLFALSKYFGKTWNHLLLSSLEIIFPHSGPVDHTFLKKFRYHSVLVYVDFEMDL